MPVYLARKNFHGFLYTIIGSLDANERWDGIMENEWIAFVGQPASAFFVFIPYICAVKELV